MGAERGGTRYGILARLSGARERVRTRYRPVIVARVHCLILMPVNEEGDGVYYVVCVDDVVR